MKPLLLCIALLLTLACTGPDTRKGTDPKTEVTGPVEVRIIALNDLHGHMEGPSGSVKIKGQKVKAGGLDALATHLAKLRDKHPNTTMVAAGDLVGASPLISALFHDEPTIEAMNALGMDVVAVGNHEFDEGVDELMRLQKGGCHPEDGCKGKKTFEGAKFPFLAANVVWKDRDETIFPPYIVKDYGAVKVGYIGLTLEGTPKSVSPGNVKTVRFLDEAQVINKYVKELQGQGVKAIVVLIHEGGYLEGKVTDINDCPGLSGPIVEINKALDPEVDAIVAGHTHKAFNCQLEGRLLTSAKSFGRILTRIDLKIDPKTQDVVEKTALNVAMTRDVALDDAMAKHIERYRGLVGPLASKRVGEIAQDLNRERDEAGYFALGGLIADAQLASTRAADAGGAQLALMNPGGVRAPLLLAPSGKEAKGEVTYEEIHRVQPFGNTLVTMTLTGAQLLQVLEMQWQADGRGRVLLPSEGFTYQWDPKKPVGSRVVAGSVQLGGKAIEPGGSYRVTVNSFLSEGGDGFTVLKEGTERVGGALDLDALAIYLEQKSPVSGHAARITVVK